MELTVFAWWLLCSVRVWLSQDDPLSLGKHRTPKGPAFEQNHHRRLDHI